MGGGLGGGKEVYALGGGEGGGRGKGDGRGHLEGAKRGKGRCQLFC